ncbi:MAG: hypothetical protein IOD12_16575 [Silvanigrellales bacterium]|nr:hypothetical protein [Silvanigrellales bacterium]
MLENAAVHVLTPPPAVRLSFLGKNAISVPLRRYAEALALLKRQEVRLGAGQGHEQARAAVAWIFRPCDTVRLHPAALESHGLALRDLLFLESLRPEATLQSACELDAFRAIVVEAPATRAGLHIAHRWTKPPAQGAEVVRADALARFERHKLVVFLG